MGSNIKIRRKAVIAKDVCVACGACTKVCPREAISIWKGCNAVVDFERCIGCGKCGKICPASCITLEDGGAEHEN